MSKNDNVKVETQHVFQHNIYLKQMLFSESGTTYCGHHHDYDHVTLVASGRVKVKFCAVPEANIPEEEREYTGVSTFVTRAWREHEITSLEPNTVVCCVHAVRYSDGEIAVPTIEEEHRHDPDHKYHSWKDVASHIGGKPGRMAFTANNEEMQKMLERANKEGTLKEGNADELI